MARSASSTDRRRSAVTSATPTPDRVPAYQSRALARPAQAGPKLGSTATARSKASMARRSPRASPGSRTAGPGGTAVGVDARRAAPCVTAPRRGVAPPGAPRPPRARSRPAGRRCRSARGRRSPTTCGTRPSAPTRCAAIRARLPTFRTLPSSIRLHAELLPDVAEVLVPPLEGEGGGSTGDPQPLDVRERVQDFLGDPVGEVLLVPRRAHVRERQHGDRRSPSRRRAASGARAPAPARGERAGRRRAPAARGTGARAPSGRLPRRATPGRHDLPAVARPLHRIDRQHPADERPEPGHLRHLERRAPAPARDGAAPSSGNGGSPESIRYSMTPSAKTSVRSSSGAPRRCSGAM